MTYPRFAAYALPVVTVTAIAVYLFRPCDRTPVAAPAPKPAAVTQTVATVTQVIYRTAGADQPLAPPTAAPVAVSHLAPRPPAPPLSGPLLPSGSSNAEATPAPDRLAPAMEREMARLDARARAPADATDQALVQRLQETLAALDKLWKRADAAPVDERIRLQGEAQKLMGELVQLSLRDRDQRLGLLAGDLGVTDAVARARFIQDVDRAFAETHLDWVTLFRRDDPGGR